MSNSPDLVESLKMFSLESGMMEMALDLVIKGSADKKCYKNHQREGVYLIYVEVVPPTKHSRGSAKLIDPHKPGLPSADVTREQLNYPCKHYMGKKVYIHPQHQAIIREVRDGVYKSGAIRAGILVIKGKGVISFMVPS